MFVFALVFSVIADINLLKLKKKTLTKRDITHNMRSIERILMYSPLK